MVCKGAHIGHTSRGLHAPQPLLHGAQPALCSLAMHPSSIPISHCHLAVRCPPSSSDLEPSHTPTSGLLFHSVQPGVLPHSPTLQASDEAPTHQPLLSSSFTTTTTPTSGSTPLSTTTCCSPSCMPPCSMARMGLLAAASTSLWHSIRLVDPSRGLRPVPGFAVPGPVL